MSKSSRWAFAKHVLAFATSGGRAWMIPVFLLLLLVSVLALVGALTPYAAFLYPL